MSIISSFSAVTIDYCSTHTHNCDVNADCLMYSGALRCQCKAGYQGSGTQGTCQGEHCRAQQIALTLEPYHRPQKLCQFARKKILTFSKSCHVGIHLKAFAEHFQMNTNVTGFQSLSSFLQNFLRSKITKGRKKFNLSGHAKG